MSKKLSDIFKSLKGSYNLLDFAQKERGKPLPRSRKSYKKEYELLNKYKSGSLSRDDLIHALVGLKNIEISDAEKIIINMDNENVVPLKLK